MHIETQRHVPVCTSDWIVYVIHLYGFEAVGFMLSPDCDTLVKQCSPHGSRRFIFTQLSVALDWESVKLNKDSHLHPF